MALTSCLDHIPRLPNSLRNASLPLLVWSLMLKPSTRTCLPESRLTLWRTDVNLPPKALLSSCRTHFMVEDSCLSTHSTCFVVWIQTERDVSSGTMLLDPTISSLMESRGLEVNLVLPSWITNSLATTSRLKFCPPIKKRLRTQVKISSTQSQNVIFTLVTTSKSSS